MTAVEATLPPVDDLPPVDETDAREPRWVRPFIIAAAALVLLLVSATGGLLVGRSGGPRFRPPTPWTSGSCRT